MEGEQLSEILTCMEILTKIKGAVCPIEAAGV